MYLQFTTLFRLMLVMLVVRGWAVQIKLQIILLSSTIFNSKKLRVETGKF